MEKTKKAVYLSIVILAVALFLPQVLAGSMGFGPTEIIGSNKRDSLIVGTASLINDYDVDKYGILKLEIPYINKDTWQPIPNEQRNIRVVCGDCGTTMVRYEAISNYSYPDSPLIGTCEKCSSNNLIFYELLPRDEFQQISIEGAGAFELRKEGDLYITTEKIPSGATCNINILYNSSTSYVKENEGKYWEVRLKATLREDLDESAFMVSGIGIRTLIEFKMPLFLDVPAIIEKGKEFTVNVTYGNTEGTWREIPKDAVVSFLGAVKPIDETGCVTFTAPITRKNFTYDITAEGDKYLSDTKTIATGIIEKDANAGDISPILFAGIGIALIVVSVVIGYYMFKRRHRKELDGE